MIVTNFTCVIVKERDRWNVNWEMKVMKEKKWTQQYRKLYSIVYKMYSIWNAKIFEFGFSFANAIKNQILFFFHHFMIAQSSIQYLRNKKMELVKMKNKINEKKATKTQKRNNKSFIIVAATEEINSFDDGFYSFRFFNLMLMLMLAVLFFGL